MTDKPTVLFCVGATKAGTTWLYDQLSLHPDCHLRTIKELHYFTCVESGRFGHQIKVQGSAATRLAALPGGNALRSRKIIDVADWTRLLTERHQNIAGYLRYLTEGRGVRRLVADMTPAYALLPEARLRAMAEIAPDVRFLYLLRDPVDRLWSHVRMMARRATNAAGHPYAASKLMDEILDGKPSGAVARGDYATILTRLRAAIQPQRLMIQFQDEMLTVPGFARLCAFLGIRPMAADFGSRVHEGTPLALTETQQMRARAFLRPQYDYVSRLFPELPASWRATTGVMA